VIEILEDGLGVERGGLAATRASLREYGNLSSAAVLFVLDGVLSGGDIRPGDLGLVAAVGPGFAAEMLLLRWPAT
jgi:alkylresorcinol/alkylpyrone synthase